MAREDLIEQIDPALAGRLATLSPGAQRWLKTAVQAIRTMPSKREEDIETPPANLRRHPGQRQLPRRRSGQLPAPKTEPEAAPPSLEDVITGKAKLDDLDQYPDLAGELEGMGEIIDMLRGLGEARRRRGEDILREEILGQPPKRRKRKTEDGADKEPAEDNEDDFGF